MIDYGDAPASDEIEVTLFGPGYGEALAVHIGDGSWVLVDSCINPETKRPASEEYLDNINIGLDQVQTIVASHWHDDHVRGISKLATKYAEAEFVISAAFNNKEAATFLSAYGDGASTGLTGGAKELFAVLKSRENVSFALHKTLVIDDKVKIVALSPMPSAFSQSIAHLAQYLPKKGGSINNAPELTPNFESIVLHISFENDAILLGSDLEEHSKFGWSALANNNWSGKLQQATAYKVAHHGSKSGDCPPIWTSLLKSDPVACMTPWMLMGKRLPTETDKQRTKKNTIHAYISSASNNRPQMDNHQLKRLGDIAKSIKLVDSSFGAVRLRKQSGSASWNVELFGAARKL